MTLLATLVAFLASIVVSIVTARVLGPSALGVLNYVVWLFVSLNLLLDIGVSRSIVKFSAELEGTGNRKVGNTLSVRLLTMQSLISVFAGFIIVLFASPIAAVLGRPLFSPYIILIGIGLPVAMIGAMLRERLAGFQRYDLINAVAILGTLATLGGTVVLLGQGLGVRELILLMIAVYALQLVIQAGLVRKHAALHPGSPLPTALTRRVAMFCAGVFMITTLDAVIFQPSEIYFLGRYNPLDQVAYYSLANNLARGLVFMFPAALMSVLMPAFSFLFGSGEGEQIKKIYRSATRWAGVLALPVCFIGMAMAAPFVTFLFGADYLPVIGPLRILMIASAAVAIASPGSGLFLALGKPYIAIGWFLPIAMGDVLLAYFLVPSYGAMGAAAVNTICQLAGMTASTIYLAGRCKFPFPFGSLLRTAGAAAAGAGLGYLALQALGGLAGFVMGAGLASIVYALACYGLGAVTRADIRNVAGILKNLFARQERDGRAPVISSDAVFPRDEKYGSPE